MKNNKRQSLVKFGLNKKNVLSLTESEVNTLYKTLVEGNKQETKETVTFKTVPASKQAVIPQQDAKTTGANVGNVDISMDASGNIIAKELKQGKEKSKKNKLIKDGDMDESKNKKVNPWAVCHAQLGPKKTAKFERCVKGVKKSIEEGLDPFQVILENKILSLVEKHVKPKMTKGDLINLIGKKKMNLPIGKLSSIGSVTEDTETAPAQPKTKPGTKTPPKTRPSHPGKNPNPNVKPAPKAKKETKENTETAPVKPAKPGIKTPPKTRPSHPGKNPNPNVKPAPKAEKVKNDMISAIMNIIKK